MFSFGYFSVNLINHSAFNCSGPPEGPKPVPNAVKSGSLCLSYPSLREKGREMTKNPNTEFQQLLQAWNDHEDLRKQGGPIDRLVASRSQLDHARAYNLRLRPRPASAIADPPST